MLDDADNGIINCIIVKDLSRFGRNAIDTGYYIERYLPSLNVRFISVNDGFDSENARPTDGVLLPLKNVINEAYALDISKKVRAQQRESIKAGDFVGARPPFGYLKNPENCHKLVVDKDTASTVQQIFKWAYEKVALNDIVRRLNEAEIPTPSHTKKKSGHISHENLIGKKAWQTRTVNVILSNEVYIGNMVQGKSTCVSHVQKRADESQWIRVENTHEAIISRDVFEAVQLNRKQIANEALKKPVNPFSPNMFRGKIFCAHCGGSLHRQRSTRRLSDDIYVFVCLKNSRVAKNSCKSYIMPEDELLSVLLTTIKMHAETVIGQAFELKRKAAGIDAKSLIKSQLASVRQSIDRDNRMLKSLFESIAEGVITGEEYRQMRAEYETKISEQVVFFTELERTQNDLEKEISEFCSISDVIGNVKQKSDITDELIALLVERIDVSHDRQINVSFTFESGFERVMSADRSLLNILGSFEKGA